MHLNHSIPALLILGLLLLIITNCTGEREPMHTNPVIQEVYPGLAEAVLSRDFDQLSGFISHADENVRAVAWHAVGKSETELLERLLSTVIQDNSIPAWQALSFYELDEENSARVEDLIRRGDDAFIGACEYFRRQGGAGHIPLLLQANPDNVHSQKCAAAVGAIVSRQEISDSLKKTIIESAFDSDHSNYRRNLLYGFYRSGINRPESGSESAQLIVEKWLESGIGSESDTDRYMVRIIGESASEELLKNYGGIRRINDIPLAVEIARNLPLNGDESLDMSTVQSFLSHSNSHVVVQTLETLKGRAFSSEELNTYIYREIAIPARDPELLITSLEYLQQQDVDQSGLSEKLNFSERRSPYLANRYLELYRKEMSTESYLRKIEEYINEGEIRALHATQSLSQFWIDNDSDEHRAEIHRLIRLAVESESRSAISGLNTLLTDENLTEENDFEWLNQIYRDAVEGGRYEFAANLGEQLDTRFPDRYTQLHEEYQKPFRTPDWDRLYNLGTRPYWRLETSRGVVEVRLDPLSAPFTVSSIDSLTRAGAYHGVAFHRIVRNFVVQGGDFDRRDGFGGPEYRIPTEPATRSFERGSVGIASSGTDTEGGQFYFMHVWAPHLDGSYTRFGEVVHGMDVVDKLRVGDKVEKASISVL